MTKQSQTAKPEPTELREKIEAIQSNIADQDLLITMALEKIDGDPASAGVLLRSIASFNDTIYCDLESLRERAQEGGA